MLSDELTNLRHQGDWHSDGGLSRRVEGSLIFGDSLRLGLCLVVLQYALDTSLVPSLRKVGSLLHPFFLRRRLSACLAFALRS